MPIGPLHTPTPPRYPAHPTPPHPDRQRVPTCQGQHPMQRLSTTGVHNRCQQQMSTTGGHTHPVSPPNLRLGEPSGGQQGNPQLLRWQICFSAETAKTARQIRQLQQYCDRDRCSSYLLALQHTAAGKFLCRRAIVSTVNYTVESS